VPLAYSFRALDNPRKHGQRVLYLKFWILAGIVSAMISRTMSFFRWVPLLTHATFFVWTGLVMPRVINFLYSEMDRELQVRDDDAGSSMLRLRIFAHNECNWHTQTFGLLPPVEGDLAVENTHTVRAFSYVMSKLPSAKDELPNEDDAPAIADQKATPGAKEKEDDAPALVNTKVTPDAKGKAGKQKREKPAGDSVGKKKDDSAPKGKVSGDSGGNKKEDSALKDKVAEEKESEIANGNIDNDKENSTQTENEQDDKDRKVSSIVYDSPNVRRSTRRSTRVSGKASS